MFVLVRRFMGSRGRGGGLVRMPNLGTMIVVMGMAPLRHSAFGYMGGLYEEEGARLYVSRGVGVTFLPLRLGAPPEIPMLHLQSPACLEVAAGEAQTRRAPLV